MELYLDSLQQGVDYLTSYLCSIFRTCLVRGYIPKTWRQIGVTLIPKPKKAIYTQAKECFPISLIVLHAEKGEKITQAHQGSDFGIISPTSVLICLPAREVQWNNTAPCDYTYRGSIGKQDVTLGAFQDIEGAFDSTSFDIIRKAWLQNLSIKWLHAGRQKEQPRFQEKI